jgi:hypothetical protein
MQEVARTCGLKGLPKHATALLFPPDEAGERTKLETGVIPGPADSKGRARAARLGGITWQERDAVCRPPTEQAADANF